MNKHVSVLLLFVWLCPLPAVAQQSGSQTSFQLSVPLLEGSSAPFDGLLIDENSALQCVEDAAAVDRLTVELSARTRELELTSSLRDRFIDEQRARIEELSRRSWWDENGNIFMLGLGLLLGVAASALIAGLLNN